MGPESPEPGAALLRAEPELNTRLMLLLYARSLLQLRMQGLMLLFCMQSLNYTGSHATLLRDASRAASTLRIACSRRRSPELRMKPESLLTCEAVAFVQVGQAVTRAAHEARESVHQ